MDARDTYEGLVEGGRVDEGVEEGVAARVVVVERGRQVSAQVMSVTCARDGCDGELTRARTCWRSLRKSG